MLRIQEKLSSTCNGRVLYSVGTLIGSSLTVQLIAFLISLILSRLCEPSSFGQFGSFQAAVAIGATLTMLRFDLAIILEKRTRQISILIFILIGQAAVFCCGLLVLVPWYLSGGIDGLLLCLPATIPVSVCFYMAIAFFTGRSQFEIVAKGRVLQVLAISLAQLVLVFWFPGEWGLTLGYLVGISLSVYYILQKELAPRRLIDRRRTRRIGVRILLFGTGHRCRKYLFWSLPSAISGIAVFQLPILLLPVIGDLNSAGFFFLCSRVIGLPTDMVARAVSQVMLGKKDGLLRMGRSRMKSMLLLYSSAGLVITIPFVWLSWQFGADMFQQVFGAEWRSEHRILEWLSLMYAGKLIVGPFSHVWNILDLLRLQALWDVLRMMIISTLLLLAGIKSIDLHEFVAIYSLSSLLFYGIHYAVSCWKLIEKQGA